MKANKFLSGGIRFECQGSGNCCVSRGGYGFVYLTLEDRRALATQLGLATSTFTRRFCERADGIWKLKEAETSECVFLKNQRCSVYQARPTQCRTWPFWKEVLNARIWNKEVAAFCPGVNKGRVWNVEEIGEQLTMQLRSETKYGT